MKLEQKKSQKEQEKLSPSFKTTPFAGKINRRRRRERKHEKHTHPLIRLELHGPVEKRGRENEIRELFGEKWPKYE